MRFTITAIKRWILAAAMAGLFGSIITPALADMETLLDKLHEKGVLSDEEYQEMRTEARAQRRAEALKEASDAEKAAKKTESAPKSWNMINAMPVSRRRKRRLKPKWRLISSVFS